MIDLHTHTTCSDGSLTPKELINRAVKIGLKAVAITDHDTIDGLQEGLNASENKDLIFIPGVEIEISYPYKGEFHLLGLGLKELNGNLNNELKKVQKFREERNYKIIGLMQKDKLDITYNDVKSVAGGDIIARPHFSSCLVSKGYAKDQNTAFRKYLNPGAPYYVPKQTLDLENAIQLIHEAGGKAIIAHPQSLYLSWGKIHEILKEYKKIGLDGIEAWHGGNSKKNCSKFEKVASDLRLIVSGGSDYHGDNIEGRTLGVGAGIRDIPDIFLKNFV